MEKFLRECVIMALIKLGLPETGAFSIPKTKRMRGGGDGKAEKPESGPGI